MCCIFVSLDCRWGVEVGEPELLAVKAANLAFVNAAAGAARSHPRPATVSKSSSGAKQGVSHATLAVPPPPLP
jgi:hypothetical protein